MGTPVTYCAADIETTGLDSRQDDIIEVGAVRFADGEPTETFEAFIRPTMPIPAEASAVNGIYDEHVADADPCRIVLPRFAAFVGSDPVVFHYAPFDTGFLLRDFHACGVELRVPCLDTCALAARILPQLKSRNLDSVMKALGVTCDDRHRSVGDATATGHVLWRMLRRGQSTPDWEFELLLSETPTLEPLPIEEAERGNGLAGLSTGCPAGARAQLTYRNADGKTGVRVVAVEYYQLDRGQAYLVGRCEQAGGDRRSFRFDRILAWELAGDQA